MMCDTGCPMCHDGVLLRTEGKLDQSGDSYLPTDVWTCPRCGYSRFEPALNVHWRSALQAETVSPVRNDREEKLPPAGPHRRAA